MNRKALSVAIASALAAPMTAQAVNVELSGQLNKGYMMVDNGEVSDQMVVDNDASSTRFRFRGSEDIGNGVKAGVYWEVQHQSNPSNRIRPQQAGGDIGDGNGGNASSTGFTERHAEVFFTTDFGTLRLGQGDGAGNGATERDLSGTGVIALNSRTFMGGGTVYDCGGTRAAGSEGSCGFTVAQSWNSFDALSRYDRVRYDTPTIGPGIVLSANTGNRNRWEIAASIRTSLAGGKLDGAIFFADNGTRNGNTANVRDELYGGSLSYLFGTGTSVSIHYADVDLANTGAGVSDPVTYGIKLGQKWGMHAFAIDYAQGEDNAIGGQGSDDTDTFGVSWVYSIPGPKVEIYAGYRRWDTDAKGLVNNRSADEVDVVMVGSRVKF